MNIETLFPSVQDLTADTGTGQFTDEMIRALGSTVEAKDRYTNGHSVRVAKYCRMLAERMGLGKDLQNGMYYAGLLHDIGKIRVADTIINKVGRLTDGEYEEMKLHALAGYYILKGVPSVAGYAAGARWHHERYDGKGYPNGLSGGNIPLISRIVSVADAYDAMTSNRSYREAMPQVKVRKNIEQGLGTQFDPGIGKIMLDIIDEDRYYRLRQPDTAKGIPVLAVDDDEMALMLLKRLFKNNPDYALYTVLSGEEALRFLESSRADLVLLDVEMPGMDGFHVLEAIRDSHGGLPVVFMTAERDMDIIQRAESMGVNDYLTKPLSSGVLFESMHNVLSYGGGRA